MRHGLELQIEELQPLCRGAQGAAKVALCVRCTRLGRMWARFALLRQYTRCVHRLADGFCGTGKGALPRSSIAPLVSLHLIHS